MERNSNLINRAIRSFIFASLLTAALQQLIQITHSIIMGQLMGPEAVSAMSLVTPLMMVPLIIYLLFAIGASVVASKAAGERNAGKVEDVFTVSMVTGMVCALLYSISGVLFRDELARMVCDNEQLQPMVRDYLPWSVGLSFVTVLFQSLAAFTNVDGRPATVTYAMVVSLVLIGVLDIFFVRECGLGVRAAALSTPCADMAMSLWLVAMFRRRRKAGLSAYRLHPAVVFSERFKPIAKENIRSGLPYGLAIFVMLVCTWLMNSMVLHYLGADGVFALSINVLMTGLVTLFSAGAMNTFMAIGGMLYGEKDYEGLRMLFRSLMVIILIVAFACTAVCELFAPEIVRLYGCHSPELEDITSHRLRIAFLRFCIYLPLFFMQAVYQVLGHNKLVVITALIYNVLNVVCVAVFCYIGYAEQLWWTFPLSILAGGVIVSLYAAKEHRQRPDTQAWTLLPINTSGKERIDISLSACPTELEQAIKEIHIFLVQAQVPENIASSIESCAEEILRKMDPHYIDISLVLSDQQVLLTIKDDGKPFNPSVHSELCTKADYTYMYGQNMSFLTFNMDNPKKTQL